MKQRDTTSVLMTTLLATATVMAENEPVWDIGASATAVTRCVGWPARIEPGEDECLVERRSSKEADDFGFETMSPSLGAPGLGTAIAMSIEMEFLQSQTPDYLSRSRSAEPATWIEYMNNRVNVSNIGDLENRLADEQVAERDRMRRNHQDGILRRLREGVGDQS